MSGLRSVLSIPVSTNTPISVNVTAKEGRTDFVYFDEEISVLIVVSPVS